MLKWHWWRFNANGFFWGMLAGILPAIALPVLHLPGPALYYWPCFSSCPGRVGHRLLCCSPDRHGDAQGILPQRKALGILEARSLPGRGGRPLFRRE